MPPLKGCYLPTTIPARYTGEAMPKPRKQSCKGIPDCVSSMLCVQHSNNRAVYINRVIIDSSARRFQAHKIYLRAAAARRWAMTRANTLRGQRPTPAHAAALKDAHAMMQQELARVTDQYVVADLRAADLRAGHWLDDDPSLDMMRRWIQGR